MRGIRLSTRPDAVEPEVLSLLREYGVTTIELGAQSMDDRVLALNGRGHDLRTRCARRRAGAGDGLFAGASDDDRSARGYPRGRLVHPPRELAALSPAEVRIYPTVVLDGTRMGEWYRQGIYQPPGVRESVPLCAGLLDFSKARASG